MQQEQALEQLGMSPAEAKLYLKLLELGEAPASTLALRTGDKRTTTYTLLTAMQKKGLISESIRNKTKTFAPTNPSLLISQHFNKAEEMKTMIPLFMAMQNSASAKPKITFYEGVSGIKQIAEMLLEVPGSTRYSFMGSDKSMMHPEVLKYIEEDFLNRRIGLGIKYKGIITGKMPMATDHPHTQKGQLRELKYVDGEKLPLRNHMDIFPHNKVAIYSYNKEEMMGVVIEHESFYTTMRTAFELAWVGVDHI